jgi:TonB family protein
MDKRWASTTPSPVDTPTPATGAPSTGDAPKDPGVVAAEGGDGDWQMLGGFAGGDMIGTPGAGTKGPTSLGGVARSATLAPRDFSRAAIPPNLHGLLQRNYPMQARMRGEQSQVTVTAHINSEGGVSAVRVQSVTNADKGFGEACVRTVLEGPKWQPRLNQNGLPVASTVTYNCQFALAQTALC